MNAHMTRKQNSIRTGKPMPTVATGVPKRRGRPPKPRPDVEPDAHPKWETIKKIGWADVDTIRERAAAGESYAAIAAAFGLSKANVGFIVTKKTWKDEDRPAEPAA